MIKVGLVGVGAISGAHIPAWLKYPEVELVALCDIRPEQMEKWVEQTNANFYTDCDEMLRKEKLDILDICLPTYLHADYSINAMEMGINVICEKPISLKYEDVERVYAAAKKNNVKFMVAQVLRFWREYTALKEIIESNVYGKLLSGSMTRLGNVPKDKWDNWMSDPKRSGLVPFDLHIHDLDFLIYTFGKPNSVNTYHGKDDKQDYIHAIYQYDDFFVSTDAAWFSGNLPFQVGFRFQFERAVVNYEKDKLTIYKDSGEATDLDSAENFETGDIGLPKTDGYFNEIKYFTDCVLQNTTPDIVKEKELQDVLRILLTL